MSKATEKDLTVAIEGEGFSSRQIEWGGMTFAVDECSGPLDAGSLFASLPTGRCECPHWGYVLEGSITYRYADREETVHAGELYYAAPGHIPSTTGPGKLIELSPSAELRRTTEGLLAAAQAGQQ